MKNSDIFIEYEKLEPIRPLLKEWIKLHKKFVKKQYNYGYDDAAYWYSERANTGVLAAAIWKKGGIALEEYRSDRRKKTRRKVKHGAGRGDLWFSWKNKGYVIEAKWCSINLAKLQSKLQKIEYSLKDAKSDVANVRNKGDMNFGILFIMPFLENTKKKQLNEYLCDLVDKIGKMGCHVLAHVFPKESMSLENKGEIYPGIILAGKVTRRK